MKNTPLQWLLIIALFALFVKTATAEAPPRTLLAFGDSLTAGHGLPAEQAFPAQLEKKLRAKGHQVTVVNAGVSGDTTSGGLTRLEWVLEQTRPDYAILELGANDMLRGVDPAVTRVNLQKMLGIFKTRKIPVLLAGMKATPNLGPAFVASYPKMYRSLARKYRAVYYPFFLEGVMLKPGLLQEDGLHPTAAGVAVIVDGILPEVEKLLEKK